MEKPTIHTLLSALTVLVGAVLLTYMIYVEDEPGAIPFLFLIVGAGWYVITRIRGHSLSTDTTR